MNDLQTALKNAMKMMEVSGFKINRVVKAIVDEDLPFMGYTTEIAGGYMIVVSGTAIKSGLVEGLLIHELSHIYRTETNHPSHNHKILSNVINSVKLKYNLTKEYQLNTIQRAVNIVQDLYADDIAFEVFKKNQSKLFKMSEIGNFFLSWVRDKPVDNGMEGVWKNIVIMLNNSFALSNMKRHGIKDKNGKALNAVKGFLTIVGNPIKSEFNYFRKFMITLEENVAENKFKSNLKKYLEKIIWLADRQN